jgi:L-lactate dehydrogenase (cytochrome)
MTPTSLRGYREEARRRLPRFLFDYIEGGSFSGTTLERNIDDLRDVVLRQRVMRDVSSIDLTTRLFGEDFALPVGLGPVGLAGMCARRGEAQAVRAAEAAGAPFCLSTASACSIEETARAAARPFWFQLYMTRDRSFVRDMLARAEAAGCSALLFTVDMAAPGVRNHSGRSAMAMPGLAGATARMGQAIMRPSWAWDVGLLGGPHNLGNIAPAVGSRAKLGDFMGWMRRNFDPAVTWKDLDFIRSEWRGPLVIKGILDPEDAREAARTGADGLVVSNHGGRQLDGALSTARALPGIVEAVGENMTVLADGGVRSGLDVVRMLALGAHGVLLGRAWVYALAGGGGKGVAHALSLIDTEMRTAMALMGVTDVEQLRREGLAVSR